MLLEDGANPVEFPVRLRHLLRQLGDRLRRAHASHDVFALGVDEKLAVELLRSVGGIAGERHTRTGVVAGVAIDHRLHVDRRAPFRGDVVFAAIDDGPVVHPRPEHRAGRPPQLLPRILRKLLAGPFLDQRLEPRHQFLQVVHRQLRVLDILLVPLVFQRVNHRLKRLVILVFAFLHPHHDIAVHLDEPPVTVPREPLVLRRRHQRQHRLVVQAEIQNRVHHSRHRIARARPHRDQQRHRGLVTELRAHDLLDGRHTGLDLRVEAGRIGLLVLVIIRADFRRNRKAGRHRQPNPRHLRQVRALAAQQRLHRAIPVGLAAAKQIHVLR